MSNQQARHFLEIFACDELAEIELGQAALEQAVTEVVQTFAARMIKLHRELIGEIQRLDRRLALHLQIRLDSQRLTEVAALAANRGPVFDQRYIDHEVTWFEQTLARVRHLGATDNDEVLLYLARQMELLEANLHLALQARAVLETAESDPAAAPSSGIRNEGDDMTRQEHEKEPQKPGDAQGDRRPPGAAGKPADKQAGPATAQPDADRLAGKGTGMDTDSSQGPNLGL